jgi:hypothetical protein
MPACGEGKSCAALDAYLKQRQAIGPGRSVIRHDGLFRHSYATEPGVKKSYKRSGTQRI